MMRNKVEEFLEKLYYCLNSSDDLARRRVEYQLNELENAESTTITVGDETYFAKMLYIAVDCDTDIKIKKDLNKVYVCHEDGHLAVMVTEDDIKIICCHNEVCRPLSIDEDKTIYKNKRIYFEELSDELFYAGNWMILY